MRLGELVRDLSFMNPEWRPSDIEQRARLLREARLLPHAGRGRASPIVAPSDVATLLIGLAATNKAVDVVEAAQLYSNLIPASRFLLGAGGLRDALIAILSDVEVTSLVREVRVCRSWPEAVIVYVKGKKAKKRAESYLPSGGRPNRRDQIEVGATIHHAVLAHLSRGLVADVPEQWIG